MRRRCMHVMTGSPHLPKDGLASFAEAQAALLARGALEVNEEPIPLCGERRDQLVRVIERTT